MAGLLISRINFLVTPFTAFRIRKILRRGLRLEQHHKAKQATKVKEWPFHTSSRHHDTGFPPNRATILAYLSLKRNLEHKYAAILGEPNKSPPTLSNEACLNGWG